MSTPSTISQCRRTVPGMVATVFLMAALVAVPIAATLTGPHFGVPDAHSLVLAMDAGAADPPPGYEESTEAQETLLAVIRNIRNILMGLLAALATLLLTISGVRYLLGGGDPGEAEKVKSGLKAAAIGYGLAVLAPALAALLSYVVTFR